MSPRRERLSTRLSSWRSVTVADSTLVGYFSRLSPHEPLLWGLALAGLVLDVVLTAYGLSLGFRELNPVARHLMTLLSPLGAMFALKSLAVILAVGCRFVLPSQVRGVVPAALALPWWLAAVVNTAIIASLP